MCQDNDPQKLYASATQRNSNKWSQIRKRIAERPKLFLGLALLGTFALIITITAATMASRDGKRSSAGSLTSTNTTGDSFPTSSPSIPVPLSEATNEPTGTNNETPKPTELPTRAPFLTQQSAQPTVPPAMAPSWTPTTDPTELPTRAPFLTQQTAQPTVPPTMSPTTIPTVQPSKTPSDPPVTATYVPGQLTVSQNGLLLSQGLTSRILATTNLTVKYDIGGESSIAFQMRPDFGATFIDTRPSNDGGFIYVINSEVKKVKQKGGVGAFTFDKDGNLREYKMVLENTTANCGGGKTPWGAWISCEEYRQGKNYQVDPTGERQGAPITLGKDGGLFESFAFDVRNQQEPHFFVTEDHEEGPMQRFTPASPNWDDPWNILYGEGVTDYLLMYPDDNTYATGRYEWTRDKTLAKQNAKSYYPNSEGIDVYDNELFFVSKKYKAIYTLNLDGNIYTNETTKRGIFDGQPDQLQRILGDEGELLYFTEEGGRDAGIHARNNKGQFFTILESPVYEDETTGLAFSPDGKHLFLAYQENGLLFEVKREDGLPFHELSLNVKYHAVNGG